MLCRAVQALGAWPRGKEIMSVCISGTAGIGGMWPRRAEILQGCAGLGWGHGLTEIINVCGSLTLRAPPMEILQVWGSWEFGIAQPWWGKRAGPIRRGLASSICYSFSTWWGGEASQELGVQSADVSALPGALPQSSVSPASYQSPWIMEVRRSMAVFWSPSWVLWREPSRWGVAPCVLTAGLQLFFFANNFLFRSA
jgi:hypothetical protein